MQFRRTLFDRLAGCLYSHTGFAFFMLPVMAWLVLLCCEAQWTTKLLWFFPAFSAWIFSLVRSLIWHYLRTIVYEGHGLMSVPETLTGNGAWPCTVSVSVENYGSSWFSIPNSAAVRLHGTVPVTVYLEDAPTFGPHILWVQTSDGKRLEYYE